MVKINYLRLNVLMVMCTIRVICDSKSIKDTTKLTRVLETVEDAKTINPRANHINCEQLPPLVLADLLGEAYNSRYMSINWPVSMDDSIYSKNGDSEKNSYSYSKRKVEALPSFYVDEKFAAEVSEKPAWDVNHALELESKLKRRRRRSAIDAVLLAVQNEEKPIDREPVQENGRDTIIQNKNNTKTNEQNDQNEETMIRTKRAYGRGSNNNSRKLYPWKCEASIKWVDLGPDYFPRYLRTVECTKHYCWYKAFICKPKSFAVKILHRRKGLCANASNLRKISAFDFRGEYGEVWKWEEVAINFCCDCAIA